ncbi:nickel-responsive regulator 1, partial [bacterium]|nr:nickel-responsive regulator 1 [bacterium]
MAQIISISLNKQMIKDMDYLQEKLAFSGRSEIVRAGIKTLIEEHKKINEIDGEIEGTIIVTHKEENIEEFSKIKHSFHDFVKTHI